MAKKRGLIGIRKREMKNLRTKLEIYLQINSNRGEKKGTKKFLEHPKQIFFFFCWREREYDTLMIM